MAKMLSVRLDDEMYSEIDDVKDQWIEDGGPGETRSDVARELMRIGLWALRQENGVFDETGGPPWWDGENEDGDEDEDDDAENDEESPRSYVIR